MNKMAIHRAVEELENVSRDLTDEMTNMLEAYRPLMGTPSIDGGKMGRLKNLRAMVKDTVTNLKRELNNDANPI
jgi:hypothetical protein